MSRTRVLAPCKVNPTLCVVARREDGYHELALTFLALDLCDELALERSASGRAELALAGDVLDPDVPADARNLAQRATEAVLALARDAAHGEPIGIRIQLEKRVPSQAGLGGGSSDAAAAALGACALLGLDPRDPRLGRALAALGSDVRFFLDARASGHARGRGRGDEIEPLAALEGPPWVVLLTPGFGAPTAAVYAALAARNGSRGPGASPDEVIARRSRARELEDAWLCARTLAERRAALVNDLEAPALETVRGLSDWRALLDRSGAAHFRLAGSGASFFGLFDERAAAEAAVLELTAAARAAGLPWRVARVVRPSGRGVSLDRPPG